MPAPWRTPFRNRIPVAERSNRFCKIARDFHRGLRMTKLVVAIGGNALLPAGESADAAAQRRRIEATASRLTDLVAAGHDVVLTHGNGPQGGNILLQNRETRHPGPPKPPDVRGGASRAP